MSSRDLNVIINDIMSLCDIDKPTFAKYFSEARTNAGWPLDKCSKEFQRDRTSITNWQNCAKPTMPQGSNMMKAMGLIICMSNSFQDEVLSNIATLLKELEQKKSELKKSELSEI